MEPCAELGCAGAERERGRGGEREGRWHQVVAHVLGLQRARVRQEELPCLEGHARLPGTARRVAAVLRRVAGLSQGRGKGRSQASLQR